MLLILKMLVLFQLLLVMEGVPVRELDTRQTAVLLMCTVAVMLLEAHTRRELLPSACERMYRLIELHV